MKQWADKQQCEYPYLKRRGYIYLVHPWHGSRANIRMHMAAMSIILKGCDSANQKSSSTDAG